MSTRTPALVKAPEAKAAKPAAQTRQPGIPASPLSTYEQIFQLQRTVGNHAVQRMYYSGLLQAKLRIGQPNDVYEQEADRVAERVMRMPEPGIQRTCAPCASGGPPCPKCSEEEKLNIRRKSESSSSGSSVPDNFVSSPGSGQSLDKTTRDYFEPLFGADFSPVRLHTGEEAAESAGSINASAYTLGNKVVFGAGQYQPDTVRGRHLLAHELTHVVQQTGKSQASGFTALPVTQISRTPLAGCTDDQEKSITDARDQAETDLAAAIASLEQKPLSQKTKDTLRLTFKDDDDLKVLIIREILRGVQGDLPGIPIYCEQYPDYGSDCKKNGTAGYHRRGMGFNIHLCMGYWDGHRINRARTLIHEAAHHRDIIRDHGYFNAFCAEAGETGGLSMAELFQNADSYACLAYLLAQAGGRIPPISKKLTTNTEAVRLVSDPVQWDNNAYLIARLSKGTSVEVLDKGSGKTFNQTSESYQWWKVRAAGSEGWMMQVLFDERTESP